MASQLVKSSCCLRRNESDKHSWFRLRPLRIRLRRLLLDEEMIEPLLDAVYQSPCAFERRAHIGSNRGRSAACICPLVVVEERPVEIADEREAVLADAVHFLQVQLQKAAARHVKVRAKRLELPSREEFLRKKRGSEERMMRATTLPIAELSTTNTTNPRMTKNAPSELVLGKREPPITARPMTKAGLHLSR